MLRLRLLGSPEIERDGAPVEVDTRKAVALLAYLVVTGRPHGRDFLAGLLWPDADQDRARAALRRTLSALNAALGEGHVRADRRTIGLQGGDIAVDIDAFHAALAQTAAHGHPAGATCAACIPVLAEAAATYRGDFLAGFALRDADTFDEWQYFQAEELRRELAGVLERLVHALPLQGALEEATGHARRWLALDPLHEPAHQRLMELYAAAGQRGAALRQYRECVRILDRELGVPPLEETTALQAAIETGTWASPFPEGPSDPVPPDAAPSPPAEAAAGPMPLVGREAELRDLLAAYRSVGPGGRLVVVEGEPGIGKTRLAEELCHVVAAEGWTVLRVRCYEGESDLAYAPIAAAVRGLIEVGGVEALPPHARAEVARLVPSVPTDVAPGPLDQPGARVRFLEALAETLSQGPGTGAGTLLFADDLQWADDASLDVLSYLVRRLPERPLCLLLSWRPGEGEAGTRLRQLLAQGRRAHLATVISPPRLSLEDVTRLLDDTAGPDVAGRVHDDTGGLPLFVVEYLTALARGDLSADRADELPVGVRELLRARADAVGGSAAQVLTAAAVIGRSFDVDLARDVSGRTDEETVTGLEELLARGLIAEVTAEHGTYDFSHPRLREIVYADTSLARRRLLHRRTGAALGTRNRSQLPAVAAVLALHHRLAGDDVAAAAAYVMAAEHARQLGAHVEALEHLQVALGLGHPDPAALHLAIGDQQVSLGAYGDALTSYERAAALGDGGLLGVIEHRLGVLHQRRGAWELAEEHLVAATEAVDGGDPGLLARLCADRGLGAHRMDRDDEALELAGQALALATEAGDGTAVAQAHNLLGMLHTSRGDADAARDHLEESLRTAERRGDLSGQVAALNNLSIAHARGGDHTAAVEHAEAALERAGRLGDRHRTAALHSNLADRLHAAGQEAAALEHVRRSAALFAEVGEPGVLEPGIWKLTDW
jgi:DNA-binding SARP family transcriptional activator